MTARTDNREEAAPADAAGHQGSHTVPSDVVQLPDSPSPTSTHRSPPTNQDPNPGPPSLVGWGLPLMVVAVLAIIIAMFTFPPRCSAPSGFLTDENEPRMKASLRQAASQAPAAGISIALPGDADA